jgi:stage II sporulation protein AB (anti-sigma F factor)
MSDGVDNSLELRFPSLPHNVGVARVAVASFASQLGFTVPEVEELRVAVSEAVSNAVIHAYTEKRGWVEVACEIRDETLILTVKDFGCGIQDVEAARKPSYSSDPERMGLGFAFMDSFMDSLTVKSEVNKGTTVCMTKKPGEQSVRV